MAKKSGKGGGSFDFKKWAKKAKASWEEAQQEASEGGSFERDEIDDGTYVGKVTDVKVQDTKNGPKVITQITVTRGDFKGKKAEDWRGLDDDSLKFLFWHLKACGVDTSDVSPEDLEGVIEQLKEDAPGVRFRLKTGDSGYQNVRVLKVVDLDEEDELDGQDTGRDDEDESEDSDEDEDEEEAPARPAKKGSKKPADDEDEEEEDEAPAFEKGDEVTFKHKKETLNGVIVSVDTDDDTATVKVKGQKNNTNVALDKLSKADTDEGGDEAEETVTPEIGMEAVIKVKGKEVEGKITAVDDGEKAADVKAGGKTHKGIAWSEIEVLTEVEA